MLTGNKESKYEALIFDLDGTMWDATDNITESWNLAIASTPAANGRKLTKQELESVMGLPMTEIINRFFPELDEATQLEILDKCCEIENDYLTKNGGILFPKLEETLSILQKKYKLCIVSNGQAGYIQTFLRAHNLGKYFIDFQNWGDNKVHKGENIKLVMNRNNIKSAAYVGDTMGDAQAATLAGIDFIYASYGFGNVDNYTYAIDTFCDLLEL